jgi:glycosyltransferase involved in cell wall biosynthesis
MEGILRAFSILKERKLDFVFKSFGPTPLSLVQLVDELSLNKEVLFKGEVTQTQLAVEMQQSDALIHFSRFETFGCVLIEANACGLPVMVSDIPVFHELVTENENGLFAEAGNSTALAEKLMEFVGYRNKFDKIKIAASTEKYCFSPIGKQFNDLYKTVYKFL